jgi:hypothetical protein
VHRFFPGHPVQDGAIHGFPARERAVAAAARGLLGVRVGLEQAADSALWVVDRGEDGMIAVNPIASTACLVSGPGVIAAPVGLVPRVAQGVAPGIAPGLGIL